MKQMLPLYLCLVFLTACNITPVGPVEELSRSYCPDSSKYLLFYQRQQGAWDGDHACLVTAMTAIDTLTATEKLPSVAVYYLDSVYWQENDSAVVLEKYTASVHKEQPPSRDTMIRGISIQVRYH
ncbi:hypothetical protein [Chitinophaga eiseniae]|uniref:hypothetical protein n=1 Tax=Chitinophaga eiseniae TaxID=634771 RepID=UPI000999FBD6|nr:hypothetical protein [Chitinophaga eiseniae]